MAYTKQNFKDGQVLNARQLNHMEEGIAAAYAAAAQPKYELIETITAQEGETFWRKQEPGGQPYKFTAVSIRITGVPATQRSAFVLYGKGQAKIFDCSIDMEANGKKALVTARQSGGLWDTMAWGSSPSNDFVWQPRTSPDPKEVADLPYITEIREWSPLAAGTVIEIKAVRG